MYVTYDADVSQDPAMILEYRQEMPRIVKALKTYLRTGRIDAQALEAIRDMTATKGLMLASIVQENLSAELSQDEDFGEATQIVAAEVTQVSDTRLNALLKTLSKKRKAK